MKTYLFTQQGYNELKEKKQTLLAKRKPAVLELKRARELGDLSENGIYKAARFELSAIDRNLRELSFLIQDAKIIEKTSQDVAGVGSEIVIEKENKTFSYCIVGEYEANPKEGKISYLSPLGKALLRKRSGDVVKITTPSGNAEYVIKQIS